MHFKKPLSSETSPFPYICQIRQGSHKKASTKKPPKIKTSNKKASQKMPHKQSPPIEQAPRKKAPQKWPPKKASIIKMTNFEILFEQEFYDLTLLLYKFFIRGGGGDWKISNAWVWGNFKRINQGEGAITMINDHYIFSHIEF